MATLLFWYCISQPQKGWTGCRERIFVGKKAVGFCWFGFWCFFFFFPELPDRVFKNTPKLLLGAKNVTPTDCLSACLRFWWEAWYDTVDNLIAQKIRQYTAEYGGDYLLISPPQFYVEGISTPCDHTVPHYIFPGSLKMNASVMKCKHRQGDHFSSKCWGLNKIKVYFYCTYSLCPRYLILTTPTS